MLGRPFFFPRPIKLRKLLVEVRFLVAVPPHELKVGDRRASSAAIDPELDDGIEVLAALFVAVDAAAFRMSLLSKFPMASSACFAMAQAEEMCCT